MPKQIFAKIVIIILPVIVILFLLLNVAFKLGSANPPAMVIWQQQANPEQIEAILERVDNHFFCPRFYDTVI